jgi:heme-degrading monooxygenase HmoA
MIARHWRGWTKREEADAYEALLKNKVLPGLKDISGYRGGYVLRNDGPEDSEFVVVNLFDSLDAVRKFAGPNYATAVFEPEAKRLLSKFEPNAAHYEIRLDTVTGPS